MTAGVNCEAFLNRAIPIPSRLLEDL